MGIGEFNVKKCQIRFKNIILKIQINNMTI